MKIVVCITRKGRPYTLSTGEFLRRKIVMRLKKESRNTAPIRLCINRLVEFNKTGNVKM